MAIRFPTSDPYKELDLTHDASLSQIKVAYRKKALQFHPDRLAARNATPQECEQASQKFAALASAYAVLADEEQKREYDHIYKYRGFDNNYNGGKEHKAAPAAWNNNNNGSSTYMYRDGHYYTHSTPFHQEVDNGFSPFPKHKDSKKKGVGYVMTDPFSSIFNAKSGRKAVASLQLPTRLQRGMRVAFSHGEYSTDSKGTRTYVSKTTQYAQGKRFSRVETTTVYPDGRREILITGGGNNPIHRRILAAAPRRRNRKKIIDETPTKKDDVAADVSAGVATEGPWYANAWKAVLDQLSMCQSSCGQILVPQ